MMNIEDLEYEKTAKSCY